MDPFVHERSIVRKIWGHSDTVLLIFAGASAEFALNKAVDWLYFTGRLPADPLGRLFSTVTYAQKIVFAGRDDAHTAIDRITAIHQGVEQQRNARIPDEAYLYVLFMLIDYSIRSFALLQRRLDKEEKAEVFDVFYRVGARMGLKGLPADYGEWEGMRAKYLQENLVRSDFSVDLYRQYHRHLGSFRYQLLLQAQTLLVPKRVRQLLSLSSFPFLWPAVQLYKGLRLLRLDGRLKNGLVPTPWRTQVGKLDMS
ncbi:MAG TPA: oxygenase MpaB family protein [Puia sp.]|jgi:uncharacterized protein (DUF2236 family)